MAINNNVHWIIDNALENAAITTTANCPSALGPDNLVIEDKSFIFKTLMAGDYDIVFTFDDLTPVSAIALLQYNADVNTIYRVTGYTTTDTDSLPVYDSGEQNPILKKTWGGDFQFGVDPLGAVVDEGDDVFILLFEMQYFRAIKVQILDSQHQDNSTEIGRAFVGQGFQSHYNLDYGIKFEDANDAEITETGDGLTAGLAKDKKNLHFSLNHIDSHEHIALRQKLSRVKNHKDILVSVFPMEGEVKKNMYTILGKLVSSRQYKHDYFNNYRLECHIREN